MKNYKYSPFNVFSIIIGMLSILFVIRMIKESNNSIDLLKILFSPIIIYPILALIIWLIDYYFQKNNTNFKKLFLVELIIVFIIFFYFIRGLTNIY
jgi:heme/copper-type cytochrome/quinol oxidase subunit 4